MIFPLSLYGAHSIKTDLFLYGNLFVQNCITAHEFQNEYGIMTMNALFTKPGISVVKENGIADISINHDSTLQITPSGQLSVLRFGGIATQ